MTILPLKCLKNSFHCNLWDSSALGTSGICFFSKILCFLQLISQPLLFLLFYFLSPWRLSFESEYKQCGVKKKNKKTIANDQRMFVEVIMLTQCWGCPQWTKCCCIVSILLLCSSKGFKDDAILRPWQFLLFGIHS